MVPLNYLYLFCFFLFSFFIIFAHSNLNWILISTVTYAWANRITSDTYATYYGGRKKDSNIAAHCKKIFFSKKIQLDWQRWIILIDQVNPYPSANRITSDTHASCYRGRKKDSNIAAHCENISFRKKYNWIDSLELYQCISYIHIHRLTV
jgi:hypothetical protein